MPLKIDRRASGIYRIRGTHHGVSVDRSAQTRSREQAEALREKWERDIFAEVILGRKRTESFAELAADYLKAGRDLGPRTEEIILYLADKKAGDVVPADADAIASMIYPNAAPSTVNRNIIAPILAIMNWAARSDRAPKRVWPRLRERSKRTDWRRPNEIEDIIGALQCPHARVLAALYVGCGLRASEAVFLDSREVAPDLSSVLILGAVRKEDKDAKLTRVPCWAPRNALPIRGVRYSRHSGPAIQGCVEYKPRRTRLRRKFVTCLPIVLHHAAAKPRSMNTAPRAFPIRLINNTDRPHGKLG